MPYFWESSKWIQRLDDLKIWRQKSSGHCIEEKFVTRNSIANIAHSRIDYIKRLGNEYLPSGLNLTLDPLSKASNLLHPKSTEAYNHPDYFASKLFDMLNVSSGDSVLDYLIYKPGVARVQMNDELFELRYYMEGFLRKLSEFLKEHDVRFIFTPGQMGSMAEETRAGFGDEYDYRLDLKLNARCIKDLFHDGNLDIRKVYNEINYGSMKFLLDLYPALQATLISLLNDQSNGLFKFVGYDFNDTGVMYLCFEWKKGNPEKEMLVKMDCVPALVLDDFWLNSSVCDPVGDAINPLCHIVLKLNTKSHLLHPAWSVSYAEVVFMTKLPHYVKDGYTLCKNLLGLLMYNLPKSDNCLASLQDGFLSSYHLKNSLFDSIHTGKITMQDKSEDINAIEALNVAKTIIRNQSVRTFKAFFISEGELEDDVLKSHGAMLLRILEDLEKQHHTRRVPKRLETSDNKEIYNSELVNQAFTYFNDNLDLVREMDGASSMVEFEADEQLDKISGKILCNAVSSHVKFISAASSEVNKKYNKYKSNNQHPDSKESDLDISLD